MLLGDHTRQELCEELQDLRRAAIELERLLLLDQAKPMALALRGHALREHADRLGLRVLQAIADSRRIRG